MQGALTTECGVCGREIPGIQPVHGCPGCGLKMCGECHQNAKESSNGKCPKCGKTPGEALQPPKTPR
jgi:predicted RNA-binding Zn-ribbon protein involved in translation (DUF1610 family)